MATTLRSFIRVEEDECLARRHGLAIVAAEVRVGTHQSRGLSSTYLLIIRSIVLHPRYYLRRYHNIVP